MSRTRILSLLLGMAIPFALALPAHAAKESIPRNGPPLASACEFLGIVYDWDFAAGACGFWTRSCDSGGAAIWEHGPTSIVPGAPAQVWGTILDGSYPDDAGQGLVSPSFVVSASARLVEVVHYFETEWGYDGGNLVLYPGGAVLHPVGGYSIDPISASGAYYAWCVDGEAGWSGSSGGWRVDCYDLSAYLGSTIALEFDFGSDASVPAVGWYLARVRVGGDPTLGACCLPGGECVQATLAACMDTNGQWMGLGLPCDPNPCVQTPVNDLCSTAILLTRCASGAVQGDLTHAHNDYDPAAGAPPASCTGYAAEGKDVAYLMTLEAGDRVLLTYTTPSHDGSIYIVTDCGNANDTCVAGEDDPEPETIDWTAPAAGEYYVIVDAYGPNAGGPFTLDWAIDCPPPPPPSNLLAETLGADRVRVSWEDTSDAEDGFIVEKKEGVDGTWQQVQYLPPNTVVWEDDRVSPGSPYYYRVRSVQGMQYSTLSNFGIAIVGSVPTAPASLVATAVSPTVIDLQWTDTSFNEAGFQIQRKQGEFGAWDDLHPDRPTDEESVRNPGVIPSSSYRYRIRAYNQFGKSAWATSNVCSTPVDPGDFQATIIVKKGTQPVQGAAVMVDRGQGFVPLGTTDATGQFFATGLRLNDQLRAVQVAQSWLTCRDYRSDEPHDDMGMRLWIDSDVVDAGGYTFAHLLQNTNSPITLTLGHPYFRLDLGVSTEWDMAANDPYWANLAEAFQEASDYLFDATDGQVALRRIAIWDNQRWWEEADMRIESALDRAHSDLDQFMDCDSWSSEEHFFMWRNRGSIAPPHAHWFTTVIHELGHYAFDLMDEYETCGTGFDGMESLKKTFPADYPQIFGFMDDQKLTTEMSSVNDYPTNYQYHFNEMDPEDYEPEQLHERGMSCWNFMEQKLEGWSSLVDIVKPQPGWFVNGAPTSPDRDGPTDGPALLTIYQENGFRSRGPEIEFVKRDSGPGPIEASVSVLDGERPLAGARVYKRFGSRMQEIGRADREGRLDLWGIHPGDEIVAYARTGLLGAARRSPAVRVTPEGGAINLRLPASRSDALGEDPREGAPGACVDILPGGSAEFPEVALHLWADESLAAPPAVVCYYGSTAETVTMSYSAGEARYEGTVAIALSDPLFDKSGILDIEIRDTEQNASNFTALFSLDMLEPGESAEIYAGQANLNLSSGEVSAAQLRVGAYSNPLPFRVPGAERIPVGEIHSFHLAEDDTDLAIASINIAYDDSLLAGIDETSLAIYRWDGAQRTWIPLDGSGVSTEENVVSAGVTSGGAYCLFATLASDDAVPPAPILDFGAVGRSGLGSIELLWTATGDDGGEGAPQGYVIAYSDSAITDLLWPDLPHMPVSGGGHLAGVPLRAIVSLPRPEHLYHLAIRAVDEAGNLSSISNPTYAISGVADPNLVSAPPTDMRAVDAPGDDGGAVHLSWGLSRDDGAGKNSVTGYTIYRAAAPAYFPDSIAAVGDGIDAFTDPAAQSGVDYRYWVASVDADGSHLGPENDAFSARNSSMPVGDFTSDAKLGIDDLSRLADTYAIDATDPEFDALFDLAPDGAIDRLDFDLLASAFGEGGDPAGDPEGENEDAIVYSEIVPVAANRWGLNLTLRAAANLAGYSFRVSYPQGTLALVEAAPDSAGIVPNILTRDGGTTPLFMVVERASEPGTIRIANVIQRPSRDLAPNGDGFLGRLVFEGSGIAQVAAHGFVLMDPDRRFNLRGATGVEDGATILRPYLFATTPNPFRDGAAIRYQIPGRQMVRLAVFDLAGRLVRTLVDGYADPGVHLVSWDGESNARRPVASGVYFYRLETKDYEKARKIVRMK